MSTPLTHAKQAAIQSLILATSDKFTAAVTAAPEYAAALELVRRLDVHLKLGTGHYHTANGNLINTLDEAVTAILADDFVGIVEPVTAEQLAEVAGIGWAYCRIDGNPYKKRQNQRRPKREYITLPRWMIE